MSVRFLFVAGRLVFALSLSQLSFLARAALPTQEPPPAEMIGTREPTDENIAWMCADLLQSYHYTQHPFDHEIAGKFLDRYLDTLDYSHLYFLQSDINGFDCYRTNLQILTLKSNDINPCWVVFDCFMDRAAQRVSYVTNLLNTEKFDFSTQDRFTVNRHKLPYPKDIAQAREFWRQELRCAYLDQFLSSPDLQYTGPLRFDAKFATVTLTRDKSHPLTFDYLPKTLLTKDGNEIGWLDFTANQSNATLRLNLPSADNLRKITNHFYAASGQELGDITFRREKAETNASTHTPATNFEAVVHLDQKNLPEVYKAMTNHYVQLLNRFKELDTDRVFETYMNSLAHAYDPHSDYMGHLSAENFAIQMKLSLFGIGALLSSEDGYCKISELKEGPAAKCGKIQPGDRIVAVAQTNEPAVDVVNMPLDKVVQLIRGPKGTQVTLTLIPFDASDPSARKDVTLIRDEIKLEDMAAKARLYEQPDNSGRPLRLGLIDLPSFYANTETPNMTGEAAGAAATSTAADVARLIKRLKQEKVNGIILDLRHNGGGYLEEAIKLTGLFIPGGPVVQTKDPNGDIVIDSCRRSAPLYDGPLVILTSRLSASASEILAGALQDYNRALIVGDHSTFGKGTVQTMQPLDAYLKQKHMEFAFDPGSLKVTIKKFYRAGGVSTQLQGVVSDVELPSIWNYATEEVGESSLPNALPCDEVTSANIINLNRVQPYVAELRERSRERVAVSKDFASIQEDIAEFLKDQADRSIFLNLAGRLAEKKARDLKAQARKTERLARPKSNEKIFEITLKNVDLAQLQPPPVKTNSVTALTAPDLEDELEAAADDASRDASALDPTLDETKSILADYISLINREPLAAVTTH
ncbi:MAG: carboxy terminal-processing peptidase [Verrucomicrobiota bacterium]|jgi:carboxyl-terminal processing protease